MGKIQDLSIHDLVTVLANCEGVKLTLPLTAVPVVLTKAFLNIPLMCFYLQSHLVRKIFK